MTKARELLKSQLLQAGRPHSHATLLIDALVLYALYRILNWVLN